MNHASRRRRAGNCGVEAILRQQRRPVVHTARPPPRLRTVTIVRLRIQSALPEPHINKPASLLPQHRRSSQHHDPHTDRDAYPTRMPLPCRQPAAQTIYRFHSYPRGRAGGTRISSTHSRESRRSQIDRRGTRHHSKVLGQGANRTSRRLNKSNPVGVRHHTRSAGFVSRHRIRWCRGPRRISHAFRLLHDSSTQHPNFSEDFSVDAELFPPRKSKVEQIEKEWCALRDSNSRPSGS